MSMLADFCCFAYLSDPLAYRARKPDPKLDFYPYNGDVLLALQLQVFLSFTKWTALFEPLV